jgi:hypothetical protein
MDGLLDNWIKQNPNPIYHLITYYNYIIENLELKFFLFSVFLTQIAIFELLYWNGGHHKCCYGALSYSYLYLIPYIYWCAQITANYTVRTCSDMDYGVLS